MTQQKSYIRKNIDTNQIFKEFGVKSTLRVSETEGVTFLLNDSQEVIGFADGAIISFDWEKVSIKDMGLEKYVNVFDKNS